MEDNDWIEIAYILNDSLDSNRVRDFTDLFPTISGSEHGSNEFNINSWNTDGNRRNQSGDRTDVQDVLLESRECSVGVPFDGFELKIGHNRESGLLAPVPHLRIRVTVFPFTSSEKRDDTDERSPRRLNFVDFLASAAEVLDPAWGFGRHRGIAIGEDDTVSNLAASVEPPLYEYNVFRRETVDHIGRDRVLSAPAWHVEELDTGGVFLVVGEPPMHYRTLVEEREAVADHLGLSVAETTKYYPDE